MGNSDALRYLYEECPSLLTGTLPERVLALTTWAARQQGDGRAGIYKRMAMALALTMALRSDRNFICALTSKPIPLGKIDEKTAVRIFVEAVNNHGPAPSRAQQQSDSRDVRAARYLLSNKIPPDEVCNLAKRSGEGVHEWAANYAQEQQADKLEPDVDQTRIPLSIDNKRRVEITIKIGREKKRYFELDLTEGKIDLFEDFIRRMMEKDE